MCCSDVVAGITTTSAEGDDVVEGEAVGFVAVGSPVDGPAAYVAVGALGA